ncbi:GEVED domain-containing protein [Chryseobacterium sp. SIMBA_028]|uniref:GEVED domain-containing protein n=5 Tax=Bacteria TaxID=2 RepID=UPI00397C36A0
MSGIALLQGTAANAPTLEVDGINVGASWNSVASAVYDYGDVPASYDFTKDGVYAPAAHGLLSGLGMGGLVPDLELSPLSVAAGANNNGSNGDGLDEDAIDVSVNQIRTGVPYTLSVPVTNPVAATRYLYGWIDFNNDGKFQVEEVATRTFSTVGSTTQTLSWTVAQTGTIASGASKLYMRLRLSDRSLNDFTTAASGGALIDERSVGNGAVSTANAANFGTTSNGEVEDYQINVVDEYDYGDAPSSFENDKDGNPLPALHAPLTGFSLGSLLDVESAPASVTSPNENNISGDNAVGLADEDGLTTLTSVSRGVAYSLTVPVNIPSSLTGTKYLYGWLDLNGDGRFQIGEVASATTAATAAANLTLTWTAAQTTSIANGTKNIYLRLRLSNLSLVDFTTAASGGALIDERSVGNGATTTANAANNPNTAFGEIEDYQLPVDLYDFGDAPVSYDNSKDGVFLPAGHMQLSGLSLGSILPDVEQVPFSVVAGANNNDGNGDGLDEDAIDVSVNRIRTGVPYRLSVPVTNPVAGTRYLYGWIDFNNDGKFQVGEVATTTFSTVGSTTQTLSWTVAQTGTIVSGASKLYMRLRLSDRSLNDFTTVASGGALIDERSVGNGAVSTANAANFGAPSNGEVEDYQINVVDEYDYGDVPSSFENDKDGNPLPALHAPLAGFSIGSLLDVESTPASVTSPAENNTSGDNAVGLADEDGLTTLTSVSRGAAYSLTVPVNIPSSLAGTKYLYGWLDLNGDGRFQAGEMATIPTSGAGLNHLTLTWTAAQTTSIANGTTKIYLRLRLSNLNLVDFTTAASGGALIDERSVGNGATTTANAVNNPNTAFGEIEDYQLPVDLYDFGDAPVSYEANNANASYPARQIANSVYTLGKTIDHEQAAQSVAAGADNNGTNGDGIDEDGIEMQTITRGAPFTFSTSVNANTASSVIAWVDFNNDGKFQLNEAAYATSTAATAGYQPVTGESIVHFWFRGEQTSRIPVGATQLYSRIRLTQTTGTDNASTTDIDERSIGDGTNTGIYTTPSLGEVEDYRFKVGNNLYEFGDLPESYEMDKNGTAKPDNFKPARNFGTQYLYLGSSYDHEAGPASVSTGADNNGNNGDGGDEDGVTSPLLINPGAINGYNVEVKNYTGANATLYAWIDFNNNGRFEATEASIPVAAPTGGGYYTTVNFTAAQTAAISASLNKVYMRVRILQAEPGVTIGNDANAVVDERAIGDGLATGNYGFISLGEVEDYQLQVVRDFGDAPVSYENSAPAFHTNTAIPDLYMGATVDYELAPNNVAPGADNNGLNGDGADEDAFSAPLIITNGSQFTVSVPVNTKTTGTKYLYGWIDLNGDGIFNGNEAAMTSGRATAGDANNFTLTWTSPVASASVISSGKAYVRFRLSAASLTNANAATLIDTRSYNGSNAFGEIEDYQFDVVSDVYDYGDAPSLYSRNQSGANIEPRQALSSVLKLGETIDTEVSAHTVTANADNNGNNGDGVDEDGITKLMPIYKNTAYYTDVSVFNNSGSAKVLYGWIDLDNDGYFEASEVATFSVPSSPVQQTVQLTWTAANTNNIPSGLTDVYMRLRISEGALADASNVLLDERSIGDGLNTGVYGAAFGGEIEDYRLKVSTGYDYGDNPDSYDKSTNGVLAPARQAINSALYIGNVSADSEITKHTSTTALGDDNADIDDEDGVIVSSMFKTGGYDYSAQVKVHNTTGTAKTLYGWIDFNNNGYFEATEAVTASVPNNTNGNVSLNWTAAQNVIVGSPTQLYMRLRLSEGTLTDRAGVGTVDERSLADGLNTGEYAVTPIIFNGEIEDHVIPITAKLDYGDLPISYEKNSTGATVEARHIESENLLIGTTVDTENGAQSVSVGSDNNGTNGDGLDEDGIDIPLPTLYSGAEYSVQIRVRNNLARAATLVAWLDLDHNGTFTANEYTSAQIPANSGDYISKLTWALPNYTGTEEYTYMRVRLTNSNLVDNAATTNVDERSIGDGLTTGTLGNVSIGEVEDYYLPAVPNRNTAVECENTDDRLGVVNALQALFHATIVKTRNAEFLVFGNGAKASGTDQLSPLSVTPANGFNYSGIPLFLTGASYANGAGSHQYMLVASGGLYTWGGSGILPGAASFHQVALPSGVGAANIKMIDAGRDKTVGAFLVLTNSGEVWVHSNTIGSHIQGDGNINTTGWHQVMLDNGTPLSGMKDIRTAGGVAIATNGNEFYTWGNNVFLGDGNPFTNKSYATKMTVPNGISLPVKQQDITSDTSASYFLRDSAGKVFVLGNNDVGQLGSGNTINSTNWQTINWMNEEPDGVGDETDVTKPIRPVRWISASNHDGGAQSLFSVITDEKRIYSTGSDGGAKKGVVNPTNAYMLTAATTSNGAQMAEGEMIFVEAGGHISIAVEAGSDRFGYVGHTIEGSDGCAGCTNNPREYNFTLTPNIGQVCGNKLLDYGDLDDRYNLGAKASHEILDTPENTALKLGNLGPDSEDGPLFTITGSGNDALGDNQNGIDDEDAFTGSLPVKVAGSPYSLTVPLTNNTGKEAHLYGFIDWNFNGTFEPEEAIVKSVAASNSEQTVTLTWPDVPAICSNNTERSFVRLRLTTEVFVDDLSTPADERSFAAGPDGEVEDYYVDWKPLSCDNVCYKPGATTGGNILDVKFGITSLNRAGSDDLDKWPMARKGGWIVLESKTKGFVPNRVMFNNSGNPVGIPADSFTEGMMVYDITNQCLKIYTSIDNGVTFAWYCISNQACPE